MFGKFPLLFVWDRQYERTNKKTKELVNYMLSHTDLPMHIFQKKKNLFSFQNFYKEILNSESNTSGSWFSGYNDALTRRRSPVQIRLGPFALVVEWYNGTLPRFWSGFDSRSAHQTSSSIPLLMGKRPTNE